ncbi:hypothetical protein VTN02DRAFT_4418 [Thermoascus thermophilus]
MVRDHRLDDPVGGVAVQLGPQRVLVGPGADRGAALVAGVAVADLLGRQRQVVEAGLGGDGHAVGAGLAQEGDGLHGGEMDDVQGQPGRQVGQGEDLGDGIRLEGRRPGRQERGVRLQGTIRGRRRIGRLDLVADGGGDGRHHLGMEHERRGLLRQLDHGVSDIGRGHGGELLNLREK